MRRKAKYVLQHHARVHTGADGAALACMGRADDGDGRPGIYFNAAVPACALTAINAAMARVAPKILTARQLWAAARHELKRRNDPSLPPYAPSFSECVDHFALHPGIHAMLRGFMKGLRIEPARMLPSFAALRDYANTSSASTWYVLAYIEAVTGVKKGDRVLQVGVGAGCKAGVNVYKALRSFTTPHPAWAHLAGVPVTEADLPLPMRGAELGEGMAGAVREYNAAAAGLLTGPGVTALALDKEEREKGAGPKGV
jgi:3-ketoacyl-CoA synthase